MAVMQIDDIELYYELLGAGEPVLFLHGLGSSSMGWQLQRDPFAAQYQVILVDVRGHGRSTHPPGPYSIALFAKDVVGLLDGLGITAVHLVGLSMGGMIGFQMAVDYPERIKSLTVVNSGPEVIAHTFKDRMMIWQRKLLINLFSLEKIGQNIAARLFPHPDQEEYRQFFLQDLAQNDKPSYKAATNAILGWSVRDQIGKIQCPVLVVAADQDYTPVTAKEAYVAEMPNAALVVIKDSRHATPIDQAAIFNQTVFTFLEKFEAGQGEINTKNK